MPDLELSEEQRRILAHPPDEHARILAGPGTGKSFTAVAYLEELSHSNSELRAQMLTFTRAATSEFAQMLGDSELSGLGTSAPSTIHGFALSILLRLGPSTLPVPLRIPDSWETRTLIHRDISRRLRGLGHRDATPTLVDRLEREMAAGWQSLSPDEELLADENPALGLAYRGVWSDHRRIFGYTLLAELPFRAGLAIEDLGVADLSDLDLLVVDEYQDLNEADIRLVALFAENGTAVIAIGDDDQSIYRWRMAAPEGIRRFPAEFESLDYSLSVSRRCGPSIIDGANGLIQTAPDRPIRPPLTPVPGVPPGELNYVRFSTSAAEARGIAAIAAERIGRGVDPSDVLLLVRSRVKIWRGALSAAFEATGIPLSSSDWISEALDEPAMRRVLALGRLTHDREDSLAWWTLLEGLTSGVGPTFTRYVSEKSQLGERFGGSLLRLYEADFPDAPSSATKAKRTMSEVNAVLVELDVEGAVLDDNGWGGWVIDAVGSNLSDDAKDMLRLVGSATDPSEGLQTFLSQLEPLGKELAAEAAGGVRLMTIASSKGLTANTVVVAGVEEGMIPMPPPRYDRNEERRLLYVAITRATDYCALTFASRRTGPLAFSGAAAAGGGMRSSLLEQLPALSPVEGQAFVAALSG